LARTSNSNPETIAILVYPVCRLEYRFLSCLIAAICLVLLSLHYRVLILAVPILIEWGLTRSRIGAILDDYRCCYQLFIVSLGPNSRGIGSFVD